MATGLWDAGSRTARVPAGPLGKRSQFCAGGISPPLLLFIMIVALPTAAGGLYYSLIASDLYVTEAKFIVNGVNGRQGGGVDALFRTFGLSRAEDDAFAVHSFMQSRDAVTALNAEHPLREIFGRPVADVISRYPHFWKDDSFEALYEYYLQHVEILYQPTTGISTLRVSAFTPEDSKAIADNLLRFGEELINRMNDRASRDALRYAEAELQRAESQVLGSQSQVSRYRDSELMIDPAAVSLKTLDLVGSLTEELARTRLLLNETVEKSPSNPAIDGLKVRVAALTSQIATERAKIVGGNNAFTSKISEYERLMLNRQFADRNLGIAFTALETARREGRQRHLYIETIVNPIIADAPIEPRRVRNVVTILLASFCIFSLIWLIVAGSKEHMRG